MRTEKQKKGISFKMKITLWFTLALIFLCVVLFVSVLLLYQYNAKMNIMENLESVVDEYADELQADSELVEVLLDEENGEDVDYLFYYQNNVLLSLYHEDGTPAEGIFTSPNMEDIPFGDYLLLDTRTDDIPCYIYCRAIKGDTANLWLRGVAYTDMGWTYIFAVIKDMLAFVPVILLLALLGGYYLTGRFLKPIIGVTDAARTIRTSEDLTRRIAVRDNGDELAHLSEAFNSMLEKLEMNFKAEQQFTANASHELRTPVAVIQAQCEYALENVENPEQLKEVIRVVQKQGYRMEKMIETLLILTRMEQRTTHYPKETVNFSSLVEQSCEDRHRMPEKEIQLHTEIQPEIQVCGNSELLYLLINNLLQNAYRYGKTGGNVWVSLKKQEEQTVLTVKDDGIGIAEKDLPHIWERFYQQDPSRSGKGMGLGLSLVKLITEYHDGVIEVSSVEGEGTTFCIKL